MTNRKQTPKHRRNHVGRPTGIEPLEQRALLSATLAAAPTTGIVKHATAALVSTSTPPAPVAKATTGTSSTGSTGQVSMAAATQFGVYVLPPAPPAISQSGSSSTSGGSTSLPPPPPPPPSAQSGTPSVVAGSTITIQVVAEDVNGNPTSDYTGPATVAFTGSGVTLSGTNLTLAGGVESLAFTNGMASFQATVGAVGTSDTFTVTDTAEASIVGKTTVNVVASPTASQYSVHVLPPAPPAVQTGTSAPSGSTPPSGQTCPTGSTPPSGSTGPTALNGPGGPGGSQQGPSGQGGGGSTQIPPPPPPSGTPGVLADTTITIQVMAEDTNGQPVPNYSGTATVACSVSGVTVPATLKFTNGMASFQVTVGAAGTETFTITDISNSSLVGSATIDVVAAPTTSGSSTTLTSTTSTSTTPSTTISTNATSISKVTTSAAAIKTTTSKMLASTVKAPVGHH